MNWLNYLAMKAEKEFGILASGISSGKKSSTAMCGAIAVVNAKNEIVEFEGTSNYHDDGRHVEIDLMGKLEAWTKEQSARFNLPAACTVYLYVYNSPCRPCVDKLRSQVATWRAKFVNHSAKWELGFSQYYLGTDDRSLREQGRFADPLTAQRYYKENLGWTFTKIDLLSLKAAAATTTTTPARPASNMSLRPPPDLPARTTTTTTTTTRSSSSSSATAAAASPPSGAAPSATGIQQWQLEMLFAQTTSGHSAKRGAQPNSHHSHRKT